MANRTWTGGTSDALDLAANYAEAAVPGNGDSLFFPRTAVRAPNSNMDGLADTLALIHNSASDYNIGSSGNELQVKCTKVVNYGRGEFWYDTDGNTVDHNIFLAPGSGGSSNLLLSASTTGGQVYCLAGVVSITGTGATELIVVGRIGDREAQVTIASGVGTTDLLDQYAGVCLSSNVITVLQLGAGRHEKLGTQEAVTVRQGGGIMFYDATDTVTRYEGNAGVCDFTRGGKALTVTTFVESPNLDLRRSLSLTTFTNPFRIAEVL